MFCFVLSLLLSVVSILADTVLALRCVVLFHPKSGFEIMATCATSPIRSPYKFIGKKFNSSNLASAVTVMSVLIQTP